MVQVSKIPHFSKWIGRVPMNIALTSRKYLTCNVILLKDALRTLERWDIFWQLLLFFWKNNRAARHWKMHNLKSGFSFASCLSSFVDVIKLLWSDYNLNNTSLLNREICYFETVANMVSTCNQEMLQLFDWASMTGSVTKSRLIKLRVCLKKVQNWFPHISHESLCCSGYKSS